MTDQPTDSPTHLLPYAVSMLETMLTIPGEPFDEATKEVLEAALRTLFSNVRSERRLRNFLTILAEMEGEIALDLRTRLEQLLTRTHGLFSGPTNIHLDPFDPRMPNAALRYDRFPEQAEPGWIRQFYTTQLGDLAESAVIRSILRNASWRMLFGHQTETTISEELRRVFKLNEGQIQRPKVYEILWTVLPEDFPEGIDSSLTFYKRGGRIFVVNPTEEQKSFLERMLDLREVPVEEAIRMMSGF